MQTGDSSLEMTFTELVFSDYARHRSGKPSWIRVIARLPSNPGLLATLFLRAVQCLARSGRMTQANLLRTLGNVVIGVDLGGEMTVGPGLFLVHPVGVTLGYGARLGENVTLANGVVLAARHYDPREGDEQSFPTIEDGVVLGAHCVVVGGVTVGRNAMVGANSVVLSDVAENTVVLGVPARRVGMREGASAPA